MARRRETPAAVRLLPAPTDEPLSLAEENRLRQLLDGDLDNDDREEVEAIAGGPVLELAYAFTAPTLRAMQRANHEKRPDLYPDPEPDHQAEAVGIVTAIRRMRG